ncbi:DUF4286 family protein [Streptomyces himalayensis]|uniref:DUF4286 family protein n=1 Tax=Streptomyces himalayensis subsp. himalayensis TaxID=2756131 RepID=A0A7W0DNY8_9ACTN|nr:DUF4286 family protein [Streptomyces himalayensis]MBA2947844.1 hypothetical protein [Streptomyces himalayensis subsp. himalayensis]
MAKHILHVESWPASPEAMEEFNRWYDEVHLPEVVALDGFVAARRYAPKEGYGPYVTQYEIEGDPEEAVKSVSAAAAAGKLNMSDTMRMDPVPKMRIMEVVTEYRPES